MDDEHSMKSNSKDLSCRAQRNLELVMPKIRDMVAERTKATVSYIDLSTAENWLLRPELLPLCQEAITNHLQAAHLSYPRGFAGEPSLLDVLAKFFNRYFDTWVPVLPAHLATAPGAASCLDALLFNTCDPGDGVLVPGPYWFGFDLFFQTRASVTPVVVDMPDLGSVFTERIVPALESALKNATCKVRALLLTNPHNPLGQIIPKPVLERCISFCARFGLHFISDEVYALSSFDSPDLSKTPTFVSALALDLKALDCDPAKVHVIWSPSKDLGLSGFRLGCIISQTNQDMINCVTLAATRQVSSLTNVVVESILQSDKLDSLININKERLKANYLILRDFLKSRRIRYIPCYAGLYVFAQLPEQYHSSEGAKKRIHDFREAGVLVCDGADYHPSRAEHGWIRMVFAVETTLLVKALRMLEVVWP